MRWKNYPNSFVRIVEKFLWFPTTIDGETRWLEKAKIKQQYYMAMDSVSWSEWINESWVDDLFTDQNDLREFELIQSLKPINLDDLSKAEQALREFELSHLNHKEVRYHD